MVVGEDAVDFLQSNNIPLDIAKPLGSPWIVVRLGRRRGDRGGDAERAY